MTSATLQFTATFKKRFQKDSFDIQLQHELQRRVVAGLLPLPTAFIEAVRTTVETVVNGVMDHGLVTLQMTVKANGYETLATDIYSAFRP
jgi:hypothetical protein